MHTSEQPQTPTAEPSGPQPPQTLLDLITTVLSLLLLSSLTVCSFLYTLQSSLSSISESPHWDDNSLLHTLFPSLLSTLQRLKPLSDQCTLSSFTGGKLVMQSDLDIASSSLSTHLHDLDLLLRSGVLHQSNAIVLSHSGPGSYKDDLGFFIRDVFTRLQIGGIEFKKKALESLLQLLNKDEKSTAVVAKEGNIGYLISLLEVNTVSMLASSSQDSRKIIFEEGRLGPLLRILETEACRSGSQPIQTHAVGALRNVAYVEDIRLALGEEGAVPVLVQLLVSGNTATQEKVANCLSILASSGEYCRALIIQEKGLPRLMHMIQDLSNSDTIEHVLRTIYFITIIQLGEFIKHGNMILQQISASLLSKLSISEGNKRAISSCMGSLVKLMESPKPVGLQDAAAQAIVSLLTVRSNRTELAKGEKSVMRLVQILDPKNDTVFKKYPLMLVTALLAGGSGDCRKILVAAGANKHLQILTEMEFAGAKKALQRLTGITLKSIFSRTWRE
ncbi:hypothetical protein ES332_A07G218200v1 [Gossypium tomentosum]|uniref:DUF7032 domain-containing protein n=1 Tax=Gossypium tomentosum TaxID=34277 RepID=A0A5D2PYS4_GOSTO|nr:hypothetical protein ES332_A07G218200v1 [Gossypium tomentosum]